VVVPFLRSLQRVAVDLDRIKGSAKPESSLKQATAPPHGDGTKACGGTKRLVLTASKVLKSERDSNRELVPFVRGVTSHISFVRCVL
jgi:hypothetical protein